MDIEAFKNDLVCWPQSKFKGPLFEYFNCQSRHGILAKTEVFLPVCMTIGYETAHSLSVAGVYTFADLCTRSEDDLLALPKIGKRRLESIKSLLKFMELELAETSKPVLSAPQFERAPA